MITLVTPHETKLMDKLRMCSEALRDSTEQCRVYRAEIDQFKADAARYRWLTTTGGGIGLRIAEVENEWNGCDGVDGFNAALERCKAKRMSGKS